MTRITFAVALTVMSLATTARAQTDPSPTVGGIQPGDVVKVAVWREPELTGEFIVNADGEVVLPRLGAYPIAGKPLDVARDELIEEFSSTLRNPVIEVVILRRITIAGEVRVPGVKTIDPTMKLSDALILAGGPTATAKENRVDLVRGGDKTSYKITEALLVSDLPLQSGDLLYVPKKNWFIRNWRAYTGVISTVLSLSAVIIARSR